MDQTKELVQTIVEGLQEKKGKNIVTVDLSAKVILLPKYQPCPIQYGILRVEMRVKNHYLSTAIKAPYG